MPTKLSHRTADELARLGTDFFEQGVKATLLVEDDGKFIAIAVDEKDYQIDSDDQSAISDLLKRQPKADIWLMRIGQPAAYRIGSCA